uniref:Ig-like domain-containing protein n=1 Tax=Pygocentrus nattereri TaxID=42514 RepID=A0A3B4CAB0_PYGNA
NQQHGLNLVFTKPGCTFPSLLQNAGLMAKWSMTMPDVVYGETGNDVVLPCHFTSPHKNYMGNITVRWRKDEAFVGAHIFSCSNKNELDCKKSDSHYSFSGNLRKNDLSLKITAAKSDDAGKYFCRVELSNRADTFESSKGTELIISSKCLKSNYLFVHLQS